MLTSGCRKKGSGTCSNQKINTFQNVKCPQYLNSILIFIEFFLFKNIILLLLKMFIESDSQAGCEV